jgi:hypothetical protein
MGDNSMIFELKPNCWGFRGDPHLWEELKAYISMVELPGSLEEFDVLLHRAYEDITGRKLAPDQRFLIERFNSNGVSSGHISSDFWITDGFPRIKASFAERVKKVDHSVS